MQKLVSITAALAIALLAAGVVLARPDGKGKAGKKTHKVFQGHDHLSKDKLAGLDSGTHHVKTYKGHKAFASVKNGKIAGMHVLTKNGQKVKGRVKRTSAQAPGQDGLVYVSLIDSAEAELVALDATITISFDLGPLHISFVWPIESVDLDALGGDIDDDA
jgi:hypothetical protein